MFALESGIDPESEVVTMKSEPVASANIVEVQTSAADDDEGHEVHEEAGHSPSSSSAAGGGAGGGGGIQTISINGQQYQIVSPSVETMQVNVGASSSQGLGVGSTSGVSGLIASEDVTRKREIRLLKNREAARECRNKKKEYIKCLENRVAVLENQNKALIEELKSLKELYTGHK